MCVSTTAVYAGERQVRNNCSQQFWKDGAEPWLQILSTIRSFTQLIWGPLSKAAVCIRTTLPWEHLKTLVQVWHDVKGGMRSSVGVRFVLHCRLATTHHQSHEKPPRIDHVAAFFVSSKQFMVCLSLTHYEPFHNTKDTSPNDFPHAPWFTMSIASQQNLCDNHPLNNPLTGVLLFLLWLRLLWTRVRR